MFLKSVHVLRPYEDRVKSHLQLTSDSANLKFHDGHI